MIVITTVGENIYQKYGLEAMEAATDDVFLGIKLDNLIGREPHAYN